MATANQIRGTFLDYFKEDNHAEIDSSPLVPQNDPTLMFTNAGMVQFKNVFLGQDKRPYNRAVTSEMCPRRWQAQRPGQRGLHSPAPHLFRNAWKLFVWRLLQRTCH